MNTQLQYCNHLRIMIIPFFCLSVSACSKSSVPNAEPGGRPTDVEAAIHSPSKYAWELFLYLNQQAEAGPPGRPSSQHPGIGSYEDNHDVVWETFARINPYDHSEVFKCKRAPSEWDDLIRTASTKKILGEERNPEKPPYCFAEIPRYIFPNPKGTSGLIPLVDIEARVNRAAFEHIKKHGLYCQSTLERLFKVATVSDAHAIVDFPPESKLIKAMWTTDDPEDRDRFHWRRGAGERVYKLIALHIVTKDTNNWFWSTFIHCNFDDSPNGLPDPPQETKGTKWENYRLVGTQTAFVDSMGVDGRLFNPKLEGFTSSCMTCHAYASIDSIGRSHDSMPSDRPKLGIPDISFFWETSDDKQEHRPHPNSLLHLPTDFVFAVAKRKKPSDCEACVALEAESESNSRATGR